MAERAALATLDSTGLAPHDVDGIITTHTTGWAVPNLDAHLIEWLGLRPTVRRIPMTTLACAGGTRPSSGPTTWSPRIPAFAIEDTFEYLLPASLDRYTGRLDHTGLHFRLHQAGSHRHQRRTFRTQELGRHQEGGLRAHPPPHHHRYRDCA